MNINYNEVESESMQRKLKRSCSSLIFGIFNQLYRHNLHKLKDIHKGERCFILGNGPSLNKQDLSLISNEISFVNNLFILHKDLCDIDPNYYCISDDYFIANNKGIQVLPSIGEYLNSEGSRHLLFVPIRFWFSLRFKSIIKSNVFYLNFQTNKKIWEDGVFSTDIQKGVNWGHTVILDFCLPIAFYMGFDEIYLLGCDMNFSDNKTDNHFYNEIDARQKKRDKNDWNLWNKIVFRSYEAAKTVFEHNERVIYNATRGGKLEVFPRVDFESLFSPRF